jgi:hypothetical protein
MLVQLCHVPESGLLLTVDANAFVTDRHPEEAIDIVVNDVAATQAHFRAGVPHRHPTRGAGEYAESAPLLPGRESDIARGDRTIDRYPLAGAVSQGLHDRAERLQSVRSALILGSTIEIYA